MRRVNKKSTIKARNRIKSKVRTNRGVRTKRNKNRVSKRNTRTKSRVSKRNRRTKRNTRRVRKNIMRTKGGSPKGTKKIPKNSPQADDVMDMIRDVHRMAAQRERTMEIFDAKFRHGDLMVWNKGHDYEIVEIDDIRYDDFDQAYYVVNDGTSLHNVHTYSSLLPFKSPWFNVPENVDDYPALGTKRSTYGKIGEEQRNIFMPPNSKLD